MSPNAVSTSVRGIGVAVITSMSGASPLAVIARRWCTPKRCCSSTTASTRSWNVDRFLEQRMRADDDVDRAATRCRRASRRARGPFRGRSGSQRCRPARSASGAMVAKCWRARISVGAISADWPPASTARAMASSADHRLAGADIALQQAQHALGLGEVGVDLGQRLLLRAGQRIGQRRADRVLDRAVAGQRPPGQPPRRARAPAPARSARPATRHRRAAARQRPRRRHRSGRPGSCSRVSAVGEGRKGLRRDHRRRPAIPAGRAAAPAPGRWRGAAPWPTGRRSADRPARPAAGSSAASASAIWSGCTMLGRPLNHSMRPRDDDVLADRHRLFQP